MVSFHNFSMFGLKIMCILQLLGTMFCMYLLGQVCYIHIQSSIFFPSFLVLSITERYIKIYYFDDGLVYFLLKFH